MPNNTAPKFLISPIPAAHVSQIPQLSPLRYPGGKTWLIPHIRMWLSGLPSPPRLLVDPFCGGGIVPLTAVAENLAERCMISEIDRNVAAFWHAALRHNKKLAEQVQAFTPTWNNVKALAENISQDSVLSAGFRALVLNRTRRGGILSHNAGFIRTGEAGKGISSRWYPETIATRLKGIAENSHKIVFCETDGMGLLEAVTSVTVEGIAVFVDPPYTAGGKRAGKRLYTHSNIDHEQLFQILADSAVEFLMTYDNTPEVGNLISKYGFHAVQVVMKTTHHTRVPEVVITKRPVFTGI